MGGRGQRDEPADMTADVRERGANGQISTRRLFMQFQAFTGCGETKTLASALDAARIEAVLYADVNDPRGVGLLAWTVDPSVLATDLRDVLGAEPFARLTRRPEFSMLGRTYASGFESDLDDWLLHRPRRIVLDPDRPWAIWYPLRRSGAFARLDPKEQAAILREHGAIGRAYGEADLALDIRLACHGLDTHDNDFVIGLIGRELHSLSHLVQAMRRTTQTAMYLESLGPFFVGRVLWQGSARS